MKRFYLLMLALLTLTLQAATVKIGYYKSDGDYFWAYDGFGQPPVDMKFGAAIRITPDMYANYLGAPNSTARKTSLPAAAHCNLRSLHSR